MKKDPALAPTKTIRKKRGTSTSNFGVGRRESHDSSDFYGRFELPEVSEGADVRSPKVLDRIFHGDARKMKDVDNNSVALVVTSPPYFAGKAYEEELGKGGIPASYLEYLEMLYEVFKECKDKLEDGGRIAVNVANLGRRPYRSLSADVIDILQNRLKLLLRGEVIWQKARGASGSCAWGSFQSPVNPVLRDLTERVIIASKGRFDRAVSRKERERSIPSLPSAISIFKDEFMEATTDIWDIPPESATRVGHPAPFPVELPQRLIDLYTFKGDVVLDPFMGSGTTAVAAVQTDRHYIGYDLDNKYVVAARKRVKAAAAEHLAEQDDRYPTRVHLPAAKQVERDDNFQRQATLEGKAAKEWAEELLQNCGFNDITKSVKLSSGVEVNFAAVDKKGDSWYFDVSGAFTSSRPGLKRTDTLWKALGKAAVLHAEGSDIPLVLLTTDLPARGSSGWAALQAVQRNGQSRKSGDLIWDVIDMTDEAHCQRLADLYKYGRRGRKA